MKKLLTLASILAVSWLGSCAASPDEMKETRSLLDGNWVLVANCANPIPVSGWLMIESKTVRLCNQQGQGYQTDKGTIMAAANEGMYRITWSNGYNQTAEYPVQQWNLLSLDSTNGQTCYARYSGSVPQGCNQ